MTGGTLHRLAPRAPSAIVLLAALSIGCAGGRAPVPEGDRAFAAAEAEALASEQFIEQAAGAPGAIRLPSGLIFTELAQGTGASPKATDTVTVRYRTMLRDVRSIGDVEPQRAEKTLSLLHVIPCWREALPRMQIGGKSQLVCPAKLAYGESGAPPDVGPNSALVFEVELVDVGRAMPRSGH